MKTTLLLHIVATFALGIHTASARFPDWQHTGSLHIITSPEGANLPASMSVEGFPLLVRLDKSGFDFSQAKPGGEDIRFSTPAGDALPHQLEHWDADAGSASIWVRIPVIKGNARREIRMHWGKADAASASNGAAVFNASNSYLSVWHLGDDVKDEAGTLESKDTGTLPAPGMIGRARHFPGGKGVFCGDKIPDYPSKDSAHTTALWFRAARPNGTVIGWGNEGGGRGSKIRMQFRSPPHIHIDSDFSDVKAGSRLPMNEWVHVVHTYGDGPRKIYINGRQDGEATTTLDIKSPGRLWLGGWYHNYDFVGDLDEVRISKVARSADWVRMAYENQKPLQTLVGTLVQPGTEFSVSEKAIRVLEGRRATVSAKAGGAQKVYWVLDDSIVAADRFSHVFDAGRVTGDRSSTLQFKAVYAGAVKTLDLPVRVVEDIPDPAFTLNAPAKWDGRETIEVVARISNAKELQAKGAGELNYDWAVSGIAVIKDILPGKLVLKRAQNSGPMTVTCTLNNGGAPVSSAVTVAVKEPVKDPWVHRVPGRDEKPVDHQFYARDDQNEGTLVYNGTFTNQADAVFLKVYAGDKAYKHERRKLGADKRYAFTVKLEPGLIRYKVAFGSTRGKTETVLHSVTNLVCGDAYLIEGQSNALATDTREDSPRISDAWIRSYARPRHAGEANLWCNPVWKAGKEHKAELGWWGMELARRLVYSQQVPIFIVNGAAGGTRIDQHQRNEADPTDLKTIYGRMLWRVREARLTHGIRGVLWHQGENDQGAAGPTGGYGWESYQDYFVEMSAAWKRDFPNLRHYYLFQIWPNACSMGNGNGDMLREVQRTLPRLYSNMDIMSTLGIDPPGGCHFPLAGWAEFARLIQPLIERDFYDRKVSGFITPPNVERATYHRGKTAVALEFDQPVIWKPSLINQFYLDGAADRVESGAVSGNVLTLTLKEPSTARTITYLKEKSWKPSNLLIGGNGIAALTFCEVPVR